MPWQAQLFIGVPVHNFGEIRKVFDRLGISHKSISDDKLADLSKEFSVIFAGQKIKGGIGLDLELADGVSFPVPDDEPYTNAIVGFAITDRYKPAILDRKHEHGRPEPFVINLEEAQQVLFEIRKFWPEAQLMIWNRWY